MLATVVALAVLTVLATALARTSAVDAHLARTALAALQADALARSGIAAATALLGTGTPAVDSLHAPWARDVGPQPLGAGVVRIRVEDEARRLDLGTPELAAALPARSACSAWTRDGDALADWTDADDVARSARRSATGSPEPERLSPRTIARRQLAAPIAEWTPRCSRAAPHVTVAGEVP
jgi:type II secretory pathway component PulK